VLAATPAALIDPLEAVVQLVIDAVSSPLSKVAYRHALIGFSTWRRKQGNPSFTRATVNAYRAALEAEDLAPSTINIRLAAVRKLAKEAAANGLLDSETAAAISQVAGVRESGQRSGNWLTKKQAQALLNAPASDTLKGKRDRAALALLVGCGLRRSEATGLAFEDIQQRDGRWVIADLRGKGGRVRTVPVPAWVKVALDIWSEASGFTSGRILRSMNRHGKVVAGSMSPQGVLDLVAAYGAAIDAKLRPHDARRTCAKLCRSAGGELEQIQLLLGHASIQTTERYLGTKQDLTNAPNDRLGLKWRDE
jgi:integrase